MKNKTFKKFIRSQIIPNYTLQITFSANIAKGTVGIQFIPM